MTSRRRLWLSLAVIALLLLVGRGLAGVFAEYRWYAALGATDVWTLRFTNLAMLRGLAFLAGTTIAFMNFWGVRHSVVSLVLPRRMGGIEIGEEVPGGHLMAVVVMLSIIVGALFAIPASDWQSFMYARGGVAFDQTDPYFNRDIGFYVYWLPFENLAYGWTVSIVVLVSALVIGLYALTPSLKWERGRLHVSTYVRRHVSVLGGVSLVLLAWSFRLDASDALIHGSAADGAFGAFDQQLGVPVSAVLSYIAVGAAFVVAWAGWTGQTRVAVATMTIVLLLTPTMRFVLPVVVRWASTPVDPALRERGFAGNRAAFTRRAYAVDRIRQGQPGEALQSLQEAASVTVWDPVALTRAIERTRRRGPIVSVPAHSMSAAGPVLITLEAGGRDDATPPAPWSVVRVLAAVSDERGGIVRVDDSGRFPLDDDMVPAALVAPGARGYALVSDTARAVAGSRLDGFVARLTEAWNLQNFRLMSSAHAGRRLVLRRDVRDRVQALLPFFTPGTHVVPVVHGDSLMWAVEIYSATDNFPLSRRFAVSPIVDREVSYFRHAGTALVQAHTGRVSFLMDEDADPIARTWIARLPVTLARPTSLAPALLAQLPPDVDGAEVQAEAFAVAGTRSEGAMRRHVPALDGGDSLMTSHAPTFIWYPSLGVAASVLPVVDPREHLSGVLMATGGNRRETLWFRTTDTTGTWGGLLERLQNAGGATEVRDAQRAGRVRLLPMVNGRIVAIQPFYGWPDDRAPYLSQVAILTGDSVRSAPTLAAAVGAPVIAGPAPANPDARNQRMRTLYEEMRAALQRGDWRAFGAAFDALGALLGTNR